MVNDDNSFDFRRIGQEIKRKRKELGMTRTQFAEKVDRGEKHMENIENYGKFPSVGLLFRIAKALNISLDQYIFGADSISKSTARRQADAALDSLTDAELACIVQLAKELRKLREPEG